MMKALDYLPLPLIKLLSFFHEELSEQRPGRLPQTMQLWAGCLLVVLISMTFEIPFVAISLAVLFYGIQSNAFTPNSWRSFLWSPRCWKSAVCSLSINGLTAIRWYAW
jgi:hypothetical protein